MTDLLIRQVTVIDPGSSFHQQRCDILIRKGVVEQIAAAGNIQSTDVETITEEDLHISPTWVDAGVILADPGFEHKEKLHTMAQAAAFGGFGHIICYPNTNPVIDNAQMVHALQQRSAHLPIKVDFMGTISQGGKGKELAEAYDMQHAGTLAFSDGLHPLQSEGLMLRALRYYQAFDGLVVHYPSTESLTAGGQMNEGEKSTQLGLKGIPEIAESGKTASLLELLAYTGGKLHLQPITSPLAMKQLQAFQAPKTQLSLGGSIAHLIFDESAIGDFDESFKLSPPLRNQNQLQALQNSLQQGAFDLLYSGHHAQSLEEKKLEFTRAEAGMLMLQTAFALANEHLVGKGIISLENLISLLTIGPRRVFGLKPISVEVGQQASFTLFQPYLTWTFTREHLFSPAQNSPFLNQKLTGKAIRVIC